MDITIKSYLTIIIIINHSLSTSVKLFRKHRINIRVNFFKIWNKKKKKKAFLIIDVSFRIRIKTLLLEFFT